MKHNQLIATLAIAGVLTVGYGVFIQPYSNTDPRKGMVHINKNYEMACMGKNLVTMTRPSGTFTMEGSAVVNSQACR